MARGPLAPFVQMIRARQRAADTDRDLVARYAANRDEDAFAELVRRHGRLVWGVCRQVLGHDHDADDAFQATFLLLARNVGSVRSAVAGWLHATAWRVANRARMRDVSRQKREQTMVPGASADPSTEASLRELQAVLHEEIAALPKKLRAPFVLCVLGGKSRAEAANDLHWKLGTISSRLASARRRLRSRLVRRGVELSTTLAAMTLARDSAAAVPAGLAKSTVAMAIHGPVTKAIASLARGGFMTTKYAPIVTLTALFSAIAAGAVGFLPASPALPGDDAGSKSPPAAIARVAPVNDLDLLAGQWLFDAATIGREHDDLPMVWNSTLTVTGKSFTIIKVADMAKEFKGQIDLDSTSNPKKIDLKISELDFADSGMPLKFPECNLPGIYRIEGDRVTICFSFDGSGKRPESFEDAREKIARITLKKAPSEFKDFPKTVRVHATGPYGKPLSGAIVTRFMDHSADPKKKPEEQEWKYYPPGIKTAPDGSAELKYEDLRFGPIIVRDPSVPRMAIVSTSPASLALGDIYITPTSECRVTGTILCKELKDAGKPLGWTNAYFYRDNRRVAACSSISATEGTFEVPLPPGTYMLDAYGSDVKSKKITINIPAGTSVYSVDPIALEAQEMVRLKGRPAPALDGVVGWKGPPLKLADLKGKYVLLEFWGYWCNPCVQSMPVLFDLHEKFADKGLVIIGIHADADGEVDTSAKLDEKTASFRKGIWKGKDLPFSVALTSGRRREDGNAQAGPAAKYGIQSWPTTVLIDRDGNVVSKFAARDSKTAIEQMEKLLDGKN